jgi:metallo-beta-lactamase class B
MQKQWSNVARGAVLLASSVAAAGVAAQQNPTWREWNQPVPPFRIAGPLYYVGMAQVTSLLIVTPQGHILVDGGFPESAATILENVRTLGFKPEEVRVLLSTHAHVDHAGGLAELKAKTGARLQAGAADVPLLARGGRGDFAFGDDLTFPPVTADVAVQDNEELTLGDVSVRAVATPGHTLGCTSWVLTIPVDGKPTRVLMVGGTSAPGYKLVGNEKYPGIVADFERSFARLKTEATDIFLEGHGFTFGLEEKRAGRRSFVDPEGYRATLARAETAFREQLEKQRAQAPAAPGR